MTLSVEFTGVLNKAVAELAALAETIDVRDPVTDAPDPGPRRTPRDLRLWLARLRLLEGVPFSHLVADTVLLPTESIRFFHLDRAWTDALVEGALSVGTVTTADRATLSAIYPVIRPEVDEAERLVRLPGWEPGQAVPSGPAGTITGFLLRSRLVSGWPALSVRGYAHDNRKLTPLIRDEDVSAGEPGIPGNDGPLGKLTVLRFERLAPAVLLVLFDGFPEIIHIEEPRAGVQFGFDLDGGVMKARTRRVDTGARLPARVTVPFRKGAPGVVHVEALLKKLIAETTTKMPADADSAQLAMQLLQFPFRSVYGDQTVSEQSPQGPAHIDTLFQPTVPFEKLKLRFTDGPEGHPFVTEVRP